MENARVSLIWQGAVSEASLPLPLKNTGARLHVKGGHKKMFYPHKTAKSRLIFSRYLECIGVPVAVAANHSFIAETATMTIHPIRLTGMVIGVPQTYEYLDKMQDRVIRFIIEHANISEEELRRLMFQTGELARDIGTILVGQDAVRVGLIDEVGGLASAVRKVKELIATGSPGPGRRH